ncbi:hypothetical protein [Actomonas aquatica]|uniref:Integral membrane protein n=1 Tax=Actomonas aquatica TaxID=2866162 RepID=A0ABZ1C566_9BACT|nr:hypothetical protein [Opitutus sp. WL0086]WRQ85659.1 hypothetical protein K1X11_012675 [Opitutus sp. WL0086]
MLPGFVPLMRALLITLLTTALLSGCTALPQRTPTYGPHTEFAAITDPNLAEVSGIAPSRREPGVYWVHNDSGDTPRIFALNAQGQRLGTVELAGATAIDWEDIASFTYQGQAWLLIADVGDNYGRRDDLRFYFLPEPDPTTLRPDTLTVVRPTHTWNVAFADGARDCEGVTVSPATGEVLLISKRTEPPVLYTLPLHFDATPSTARHVARRVTPLPGIAAPTTLERALPGRLGQFRSQVTAFDLCADGTCAAVLTYGNIWIYQRQPGETWTDTFTRDPARIPISGLTQAEAICFEADNHDLIVTTERLPAPLLRYEAK